MDGPLLITTDPGLREAVHRLAAAAGVLPEEAPPRGTSTRWRAAPMVLCDAADLVELEASGVPRRDGVWVVSTSPVRSEQWPLVVAVGASGVLELPQDADPLARLLGDLADRPGGAAGDGTGRVLGVLGASGGVGASVLAAALACRAPGPSLLVDLDPGGGGGARLLGVELSDGVGWEEVAASDGRLGAGALRGAVPARDGTGVLGWRGVPRPVPPEVVRVALDAAVRGHGTVVLDLPRHPGAAGEQVLDRCDGLVVLVRPDLAGLASAGHLLAELDHPDLRLVVRGRGRAALVVERLLRRDVHAVLPRHRGLEESLALGHGPPTRRGPLAVAAEQVLAGWAA